ncbi:MAG: class I SAM-dependent DNA methyltransferase [Bulleidia sp.]|nr:class I SAM-dependent DNA methyltransferase [Bulleidia sp.]
MVTGELKNKIDGLWDVFATGGLTNPLEVIEQITYLMFIHDLDVTDNKKAKDCAMLGLPFKSIFSDQVQIGERSIDGQQLKWSVFRDLPANKMYEIVQEWVFPFIKNLHSDKNSAYSKYMDDAIFKLPTPLVLSRVIDSLDDIYALMGQSTETDIRGDVYEYLLSKISTAGRNGQFRTPRHIISMMVELMNPQPNDIICDPACGTGGFLVGASDYLQKNYRNDILMNKENREHYMNHMFHGFDMDRTMLRIGAMNMMTHGVESPFIEYRDSLSDQNLDKDKYSMILANPPFKGSLDADSVSADLLKVTNTKKTELLFLALFIRMLKIGGRCACIVPDGVLFGSSNAHKQIRKTLIEDNRLEAVISMPSGVFKPYAGVSTGILIFTKTGHGGTDKVWFYDMKADGYSLDDKRTQVKENDIPDIIERFKHLENEIDRKRTEQSFFIDKEEIVKNDYDLSINKYKEVVYEKVEYPPTSEILAEIESLNNEINKNIAELKVLLMDGKEEKSE